MVVITALISMAPIPPNLTINCNLVIASRQLQSTMEESPSSNNNNNNNGYLNPSYVGSPNTSTISIPGAYKSQAEGIATTRVGADKVGVDSGAAESPDLETGVKREGWNNDIEFLMSCIALSVGLGNVWRFPFIALENGGGAFLIPYLIVLILVGKPVYYMEMLLGQFSSRGSVKVYDFVPILRGECGVGRGAKSYNAL